jgi:hypothetical protein
MTGLVVLGCTLGACGSDTVTPANSDAGSQNMDGGLLGKRYLPLSVGATWTYLVTDPTSGSTTKTQAVQALEDVGGEKAGVMAFRVRTEKSKGVTVSWQEDLGDRVVRHREQAFDSTDALKIEEVYVPSKLRLDETAVHLAMSAQWMEEYTEKVNDAQTGASTNVKTEQWAVVATDEMVTVPAGTFRCLHVSRAGDMLGQSQKDYYFARGVGKVKEVGSQTEELMSHSVP